MARVTWEDLTELAIARERLEAIRDHAHRCANGLLKQPGKQERIGDLKAALRSIANTAETALQALRAYA